MEALEDRHLLSAVTDGPEFRVNSYLTDTQRAADVATDADGDFVVVWQSRGQDGSFDGVYAQRYSAAGANLGPEFQVNTFTSSLQTSPAAAMDADGNFVLVWQSFGQDGDNYGIYARRYDSTGIPLGNEFRVNTTTASSQNSAAVAMADSGEFVVSWTQWMPGGGDGQNDVYAQRFDSAGAPQGSEFRVNSYTTLDQSQSAVAMDADGDFVVIWTSAEQDGDDDGIYGQRYDRDGIPQAGEFRVNSHPTGEQQRPRVDMDADGDFVVTWTDNDRVGIYARRYAASGAPQGGEFAVDTETADFRARQDVALDADGNFVVTWDGSDPNVDSSGVFARRYTAGGAPREDAFLVNTYTNSVQSSPAVAMDAVGDFVIAWTSAQDGGTFDAFGIYAQRYVEPNPTIAQVAGRHVFYNESRFDNRTPGIDPADSAAIATDKRPYFRGGGTITAASMTSYSRGINGLFVDLRGPHETLSLADFDFKANAPDGLNNAPESWPAAPAPSGFSVLSDTPVAGTDRVEFIWPNGAIKNQYLQVTVKGNDAPGGFNTRTGLRASDVFYFGNLIGDTFDPTLSWFTNSSDEVLIQRRLITFAPIYSPWDIDRNGFHLASDLIEVRRNRNNSFAFLAKINVPESTAIQAALRNESQGELAVASALAARHSANDPTSPLPMPAERPPVERSVDRSIGHFTQPVEVDDPRAARLIAETDEALDQLALDEELLASLSRQQPRT